MKIKANVLDTALDAALENNDLDVRPDYASGFGRTPQFAVVGESHGLHEFEILLAKEIAEDTSPEDIYEALGAMADACIDLREQRGMNSMGRREIWHYRFQIEGQLRERETEEEL